MLTYEGEEPLVDETAVELVPGILSAATPEKLVRTPNKPVRTMPKHSRTLFEDRTQAKYDRSPIRTLIKSPSRSSIRTPPAKRWSPVKALLKYTRTPTKSNRSPIRTPTKFIGTPTKLTTSYRSPIRTLTKFIGTPTKLAMSYRSPETPVESKMASNRKHCRTLPRSTNTFDLGVLPSTSCTTTPIKPIEDVVLITPPSHGSCQDTWEGTLAGIDPVLMEDSASMVAYSLSTPMKDIPRDFHDAFHQSHDHKIT